MCISHWPIKSSTKFSLPILCLVTSLEKASMIAGSSNRIKVKFSGADRASRTSQIADTFLNMNSQYRYESMSLSDLLEFLLLTSTSWWPFDPWVMWQQQRSFHWYACLNFSLKCLLNFDHIQFHLLSSLHAGYTFNYN